MSDKLYTGRDGVLIAKSNPQAGDAYVAPGITNLGIAYIQTSGAMYPRLFPFAPQPTQAGKYPKWNKGDFMRARTSVRHGGGYADIGFDVDFTNTYFVNTFGGKKKWERLDATAYDGGAGMVLGRDRATVALLGRAAELQRELGFVSAAFTTGVWGTDKVGGTDFTKWDDPSSQPITDVRDWKRTVHASTGMFPNKIGIGRAVFDALMDNPQVMERIGTGTGTAALPRQAMLETLARLFELDEVVVGDMVYESANKGETSSMAYAAGKHALLLHVTNAPSREVPSAGYTFTWQNAFGNAEGVLYRSGTNTEDNYDWSTIDHGEHFCVTASDLGLFAQNAVSG